MLQHQRQFAPQTPEPHITADSPRSDIDAVLFDSSLVKVGRWRCPAHHPQFADSGPSSDALFVFPRDSVWIEHEGGMPFVADPNTVTYYNKHQCYRRAPLSARGDRCEWFAVAPEAITEVLATHEPAAIDRPGLPFPFAYGPSDADSYLRQRLVFHHVSTEAKPDRLFVEEVVLSVLGDVTKLAYSRRGMSSRLRKSRRDTDVIEAARDVITRRFTSNLSLPDIANEVDTSIFHLSRIFKSRTGLSLHAYRNQLRLRVALERLQDANSDLTAIALDLGFSSHSHFTSAFGKCFGRTPSTFRESLY